MMMVKEITDQPVGLLRINRSIKLDSGDGIDKQTLKAQFNEVGIEDRGHQPIEIQNAIKAAEITYVADAAIDSCANGISNTKEAGRQYPCNDNCDHDDSGACSAACSHWNSQWIPILKLVQDACNDHATSFQSLPTSTTAVSVLTDIASTFARLKSENAAMSKSEIQESQTREEFVNYVYRELCEKIAPEFHKLRNTIRSQICCIDKIASKVATMCKCVISSTRKQSWLAQSSKQIANHVSKCTKQQLAQHVKTMQSTADDLVVAEKFVHQLVKGCETIAEHVKTQLDALRAAVPDVTQRLKRNEHWKRVPSTANSANLDVWSTYVYGHNDCSDEKFCNCLRAFIDTEPYCNMIVHDAAVFFRDCYQNLAWFMEQNIKRARHMAAAFDSLGQALVQQRFIVGLGVFMARVMEQAPTKKLRSTAETSQNLMDPFTLLFGSEFQTQMTSSDFLQIQIELDSHGKKLPGTLREYSEQVFVPKHLDAIQQAARELFTSELDFMSELVSQCQAFDSSGLVVSTDDCYSSEEWKAVCNAHAQRNITDLCNLMQAVIKYMNKKHPCTTEHCECCPSAKLNARQKSKR